MNNKIKKMFSNKQRFGFRKLTVGLASVLLGLTFLGVSANQVNADTTGDAETTPKQEQVVENQPEQNVQNGEAENDAKDTTKVDNQQVGEDKQVKPVTKTDQNPAVANKAKEDDPDPISEDDHYRPGDDVRTQLDENGKRLPVNENDLEKGNVKQAWEEGYKGQGTAIAVIDSGANVHHQDFQTMPDNPKLTKDKIDELIKKYGLTGEYVNNKFPYVHDYYGNDNDIKQHVNDDAHGQHVSGIVAADGQEKDGEYMQGVAPEAQLINLKYLDDAGNGHGSMAQAIIDATNLGADVIQISIGADASAINLNDSEQAAVKYATEHGVLVSLCASNDGNAASVRNVSNIKNKNDYASGTNKGNYEPVNSGTISTPGVSTSAITVAAESSATGRDSDMATFSSWGPLPDFTLKPDVSAPGEAVLSLGNKDNNYVRMSGTSMATPFVSGAAALVKERLAKTNPELKGEKLVAAIKAILMNTAKPQTQNGYDELVSPRRQGAGQIDVGAAVDTPVYVTTKDGSSVSLKQINGSTSFELTFNNLSDQAQDYTFDEDFGGVLTEARNSDSGEFYEERVNGASVTTDNRTIHVDGNGTAKYDFTLNVDGVDKDKILEGFLHFTNSETNATLVVPYLAYYGDPTHENVFDKNANDPDGTDIQGNYFANEDGYPRGIADEDSIDKLINDRKLTDDQGNVNWQVIAKLYESGKVAFSPNNDSVSDQIMPYTFLKQNIQDLKVEILDANGKVVRVLVDKKDVAKSFFHNGDSEAASATDYSYKWDGQIYDQKTNKMVIAPDGTYTYRFVATLYGKGDHQVQTNDTPIIIDTTKPTLSNVKYDDTNFTLSGDYQDTGAGFTSYSYANIQINNQVFQYKLDEGNSKFTNNDKTKGHFSFELDRNAQAALANAKNKIIITLGDVADNFAEQSIYIKPVKGHEPIAIWNATDGEVYDTNSKDYHKSQNDNSDDTYTLRGSASAPFYVNGNLVKPDKNGEFAVEVPVNSDDINFTSDKDGRSQILTFTPTISQDDNEDSDNDKAKEVQFVDGDVSVTDKDDFLLNKGYEKYDPNTRVLTISGHADEGVSDLIVNGQSINPDEKGNFTISITLPESDPSSVYRPISYSYQFDDNHKEGNVGIAFDTLAPTLTLDGVKNDQDTLEFTTNKPTFELKGQANDNADGYTVQINGDQIFTQRSRGYDGLNYYPELFPGQKTPNNYDAYDIDQIENLNDDNGKPTTHHFAVTVTDQVGNQTTKTIIVHYDPNWKPGDEEHHDDNPSEPVITPVYPTPEVPNRALDNMSDSLTGNNNLSGQNDAVVITLTHNAYEYDKNGQVILQNNKPITHKVGEKLLAWNKGQIAVINGKRYYQIGENAFVKEINTLKRNVARKVRIKVIKNSYVYNNKGRALRRKDNKKAHEIVKKGKYITVLDNKKTTIKGKKFYRIGRNKYIKVVNTKKVVVSL